MAAATANKPLARANTYLSVGAPPCDLSLRLAEPDDAYAAWLRVVLMRITLVSASRKPKTHLANTLSDHVEDIWGIQNFEPFLGLQGPTHTHAALKTLLSIWEAELPATMALPPSLAANVQGLSGLLDLNATESAILAFTMLLHGEALVDEFTERLGSNVSAHQVPRILAEVLHLEQAAVREALSDSAALTRTGLVTLDVVSEGSLRSRIDPIYRSFSKRMFMPHAHARDVVGDVLRPAKAPRIGRQDLQHVLDRLACFGAYLRSALQSSTAGVNVLIYGVPGTGKTEFARFLAHDLGCDMLEVGVGNARGSPVPPNVRFKFYKLAQALLGRKRALVLFDECEEVLNSNMANLYAGSDDVLGHKSWLNAQLESNHTPTLWVANGIEAMDPALLRRFDLVMEMPLPPQSQRQAMLLAMSEGLLDAQLAGQIASSPGSTPAMLAQTTRVLKAIAHDSTINNLAATARTLVNDRLALQGLRPMHGDRKLAASLGFDPLLVNSSTALAELQAGLGRCGSGRICLYGPPGTGKTAFGKWLAQSLDRPSHLYKASDLLAAHVGESERNIAQAFAKAHRERAVLQIDEIDSFLQTRSAAQQGWEISLVNEMLTQLEDFDGIFVATTNRFEQLDPAVLRRFDLSLKFGYLQAAPAWALFQRSCSLCKLGDTDPVLPHDVARLRQLTPGDFDQVLRQSAYRPVAGADDLLARLREVLSHKPPEAGAGMGFLPFATP